MASSHCGDLRVSTVARETCHSMPDSPRNRYMRLLGTSIATRPRVRQQAAGYVCTRKLYLLALCSNSKEQPHLELPDTSALNKTLQQQWDATANAHLGNVVVSKFSSQKVWWQCHGCPDGHLHQWQATVQARSYGSGCPQCSGRKLCKHNSLATLAPHIAVLWDTRKNGCTADMVLAHTNKRCHWHCHRCQREWTAFVASKVQRASGCCACNRSHTRRRQPTFAQCQHPLLAEWDHQQNAAEGLFPDKITLNSHKKVHWLCSKCPSGQQHSWTAKATVRARMVSPSCPFCAGRATCKCNSLQTQVPSVAAEWDYDKNPSTPQDFTSSSNSVVWWCNPARGSWQQSINACTNLKKQIARKRQYVQDQLAK